MIGRPPVPLEIRFWRFVTALGPDDCWLWRGAKDKDGYGFIKRKDKTQLRAHRVSFEMHWWPLQEGELVCHTCDTPSCVNPGHLFAGSLSHNSRDMIAKGRAVSCPGEANGMSKLTAAQVAAIRKDQRCQREIGASYGICQSHVSALKSGKRWALQKYRQGK